MSRHDIQQERPLVASGFFSVLALYIFLSLSLGILSLSLSANPDGVAIIWLPAGLALVGLVFIDKRLWIGIAIVAFASNFYSSQNIQAASGICFGSAAGAIIAAAALRTLGPWKELSILPKALKLGTMGGAVSSSISAAIGVASLYFAGAVPTEELVVSWSRWLIGDWIAIFLFSSFILIYFTLVEDIASYEHP